MPLFHGRRAIAGHALRGFSLYLSKCPRCEKEWLRPAVMIQPGQPDDKEASTILGRARFERGCAQGLGSRANSAGSRLDFSFVVVFFFVIIEGRRCLSRDVSGAQELEVFFWVEEAPEGTVVRGQQLAGYQHPKRWILDF